MDNPVKIAEPLPGILPPEFRTAPPDILPYLYRGAGDRPAPAPAPAVRPEGAAPRRLVKAPLSPTQLESPENTRPKPTPAGTPGAEGIIEYREWAEEWRLRTKANPGTYAMPPGREPVVETDHLTEHGAKVISESCYYVAKQLGGYRTFLTLTFNQAQREAIAAGELTVQREVSRLMDALTKMYRRGWRVSREAGALSQKPQPGQLLYCWVAENPRNQDGDDNPHVHVLLNWRVPRRLFQAWARRVETLWGHGFAHLEKIKDADAAGGYLLKALGYLTKGADTDQGKIRGNRYGLSAAARAPAWVVIERRELGAMGALIADIHQHLTERYGELYRERRRLAAQREKARKAKAPRRHRNALARRLASVRDKLNREVPIVANRYSAIVKGREAFDQVRAWLGSPGAWNVPAVPYLPAKGPGECWENTRRPRTGYKLRVDQVREEIYRRRAMRRTAITDYEFHQAIGAWQECAAIAAEQSNQRAEALSLWIQQP